MTCADLTRVDSVFGLIQCIKVPVGKGGTQLVDTHSGHQETPNNTPSNNQGSGQ